MQHRYERLGCRVREIEVSQNNTAERITEMETCIRHNNTDLPYQIGDRIRYVLFI